jgi:hypothetical protein
MDIDTLPADCKVLLLAVVHKFRSRVETKVCGYCGKSKPLNHFYKHKGKKCGYTSGCKECTSKKNLEHYHNKKERLHDCIN